MAPTPPHPDHPLRLAGLLAMAAGLLVAGAIAWLLAAHPALARPLPGHGYPRFGIIIHVIMVQPYAGPVARTAWRASPLNLFGWIVETTAMVWGDCAPCFWRYGFRSTSSTPRSVAPCGRCTAPNSPPNDGHRHCAPRPGVRGLRPVRRLRRQSVRPPAGFCQPGLL